MSEEHVAEKLDKALWLLASHAAMLRSMEDRLNRHEDTALRTELRIIERIDDIVTTLRNEIREMDARMRRIEQASAVYGSAGGALISTLISIGVQLFFKSNCH